MHSLNLDPKFIARQYLLLGVNFEGYPTDDETVKYEVGKTLKTNVWPLVQHISSFSYQAEMVTGVTKLANFPENVPPSEKWMNIFANHIATGKKHYAYSFTEAEITNMKSDLREIYFALLAIRSAVPFIHLEVNEGSDGEINLEAMDVAIEDYNLTKSIGD